MKKITKKIINNMGAGFQVWCQEYKVDGGLFKSGVKLRILGVAPRVLSIEKPSLN